VSLYCRHNYRFVSSINHKYQYSSHKCYCSVLCIHIHSYETLANMRYYKLSFVCSNTISAIYIQTVFQHQIVAVFFVILLIKLLIFCVETISGTKLKIHSKFDRHLLMNNHHVHIFYISLNQNSGNSYPANLVF
jgi:hypothetical protein